MKIRTDDEVIVISGKDIGKKGTITRVFPTNDKVIVTGSAVGVPLAARAQPARA